jgi:hypothetical protein
VVRPRSCPVIYYFDTPTLGIRHQSFDHVKYYDRSIIVLYWMLIITNGCMSTTRDLLLYCIEDLISWMVRWVIWRVYYCIILNAKLLWNVCLCITKDLLSCLLNGKLLRNACTSITKGLLLCCSECQIIMNRLNEQFKGYYHVIVIS